MKREDKLKLRTLADIALAATIMPTGDKTHPHRFDPGLRTALLHARRFVLDDSASTFLAHLTFANFPKISSTGEEGRMSIHITPRTTMAIEATRMLARLPHRVCWFEYDYRNYERTEKLFMPFKSSSGVARIGWLLRTHDQIETAFRATIFSEFAENEDQSMQQPFDLIWKTDDDPLPWQCILQQLASEAEDGIDCQVFFGPLKLSAQYGLARNRFTDLLKSATDQHVLATCGMELRRILTLLATINDVPFGVRVVEPSHGYMSGRRYTKFLSHSVIKLDIPKGRDPQKLARSIIAISRRRAHQVRGHWRRDWRHEGNRVWVKEHQRGDASLGFVTHDYEVAHTDET